MNWRPSSKQSNSKGPALLADVEVYQKAARWILEFPEEFFSQDYVAQTLTVLDRAPTAPASSPAASRRGAPKRDGPSVATGPPWMGRCSRMAW